MLRIFVERNGRNGRQMPGRFVESAGDTRVRVYTTPAMHYGAELEVTADGVFSLAQFNRRTGGFDEMVRGRLDSGVSIPPKVVQMIDEAKDALWDKVAHMFPSDHADRQERQRFSTRLDALLKMAAAWTGRTEEDLWQEFEERMIARHEARNNSDEAI